MQPFWLVRRLTVSSLKKEQENGATLNFNLEFKEKEFQTISFGLVA